ncbi:ribonuclease R [Fusibacter paucivorans]|uniref:Ribonuclease R n=2 Tax=Fusibacter paucivorans TaxID=76009 RepID=A0ABS5PVJ6_9FIRM|nr:ribonuclease R [Fusibacter paucivorans]
MEAIMTKEQIIDFLKAHNEKPFLEGDLISALQLDTLDMPSVLNYLNEMVEDGQLIRTKKKKLALPEFFEIYVGKIQMTQKGFGFAIIDSVSMGDVFIPASALGGAMNGDRVMVKLTRQSTGDRRNEGEVIKIIERVNTVIVGTYEESKNFGFVVPDDQRLKSDIFISRSMTMSAKQGDKVVVEITRWPEDRRNPEGKVIEILGQVGDPGVDILSVIRTFKLPEVFNERVLKDAEAIPTEVDESEIQRREDFRNETIVTIDGKDAKDLDDAVHVKRLPNGNYELGVHIADVSYYVHEYSKIDKEALKRATSVYLLNRVIPMLPERLSNGICSLNPQVNRLTMSCIMEIDSSGDVVDHRLCESVIKTVERMNYDDVSDILEDQITPELEGKYGQLFDFFENMKALSLILRGKRERRGAIDFNFAETKIKLDGDGKAIDVGKAERRIGHKIIEEFMLAANETVAEHMFWLELPFVYRIHETPAQEKIDNLNKFLYNFGYRIKGNTEAVHPKAVRELLTEVENTKEEHVISKLTLRSLKQARYSPQNDGHFGLAAKYYCHFTSPIRRYPDLQIHRIIREMLQNELDAPRIAKLKKIVEEVSVQSSERERNADLAERDVDDMKMAEYMQSHIGETYTGLISSITSFGMFVELENTVEGLIRLDDLDDDYYVYDEEKLQLVGQRTRHIYKLGDEVEIIVVNADPGKRQVDFELA